MVASPETLLALLLTNLCNSDGMSREIAGVLALDVRLFVQTATATSSTTCSLIAVPRLFGDGEDGSAQDVILWRFRFFCQIEEVRVAAVHRASPLQQRKHLKPFLEK